MPAAKKAPAKKTAAKKAPTKKTPTMLTLANRRVPLRAPRSMSAHDKAQVAWVLKHEGAGSLAAAAKDEEWRDGLEAVDVTDAAGHAVFQLWLWPSGSAVLFRAGTSELVGQAVQHVFMFERDEPGLRESFARALEGADALGVSERIQLGAASTAAPKAREGAPSPAAGSTLDGELADLRAGRAGHPITAGQKLMKRYFGKAWSPYPKRRPASLTPEQRKLLDAFADLELTPDLEHYGLPHRDETLARYLGRTPAGPSDVVVHVGTEEMPLWCAVTDVGSEHLKPEPVQAAFRRLPPAVALAAWQELARGAAYDIMLVHPRSMAESGRSRTPYNVKHRARLFSWLADACVSLGEPGREAAAALVSELPKWDWEHPAFVGLVSLTRHAKAKGEVLPAALDAVIARLRGPEADVFAEPILKEIVQALPKERAVALT
jgi:hypothetical protein